MAAVACSDNNAHLDSIFKLPVDARGFVSEADRDAFFRRLRARLDNRQCIDCHNRNPTWLSLTYGVFVCLTCSGTHRRMGTHISFVRSCELDKFTPEQLVRMELGGNKNAVSFFKSHGVDRPDYHSKIAAKYKVQLDKSMQMVLEDRGMGETGDSGSGTGEQPVPGVALTTDSAAKWETELAETVDDSADRAQPLANTPQPMTCDMDPQATTLKPIVSPVRLASPARTDIPLSFKGPSSVGHALLTHQHATAPTKQRMRAVRLTEDFDFDSLEKQAATTAGSSKLLSSNNVTTPAASVFPSVESTGALGFPAVTSRTGLPTCSSAPATEFGGGAAADRPQPQFDETKLSKYSNAKAISSADFFNTRQAEETDVDRREMQFRVQQFHNCKSISSAAFLAQNPGYEDPIHARSPSLQDFEQTSKNHVAALTNQARQGIQILATGAQETVSKAKDWLSNFLSEGYA